MLKGRTTFEIYCSLVCVISLGLAVFVAGNVLLNTYYFFYPDAGLHPSYRMDYESPIMIEFPPGYELPERSAEQIYAEKNRQYMTNIRDAEFHYSYLARQYSMYLLLLISVFIGHVKLLKSSSGRKR